MAERVGTLDLTPGGSYTFELRAAATAAGGAAVQGSPSARLQATVTMPQPPPGEGVPAPCPSPVSRSSSSTAPVCPPPPERGVDAAKKELRAAMPRLFGRRTDPTQLGQAIAAARQHGVDAVLIQKARAALEQSEAKAARVSEERAACEPAARERAAAAARAARERASVRTEKVSTNENSAF